MVFQKGGCVYIITNKRNTVLYTGVTSDIIGRIWEHKNKVHPKSFTARYGCDKLVYYCCYSTIVEAIAYEKAIKGGSRDAKLKLIEFINPEWKDLYDGLVE
ncbi:GIY-YIG nuclease family protein [Mucilaginibacter sp. HMF5004]|uniref:GIY-YIG nuclease family protein n=1 Tax=Mucilaginibacter rivuli TaxID=2857527 RepID=UPI001C5E7E90|nr:GIY-YIG nuclease family protein [Mucilaginibacter rivuli]MBW4891303.1 GIY-YIG nuclease family protein [Mucilaginibacter rivuli]